MRWVGVVAALSIALAASARQIPIEAFGGGDAPLLPHATLPEECDSDSSCIMQGIFALDRMIHIRANGHDDDGSGWNYLGGGATANSTSDFIRFSEIKAQGYDLFSDGNLGRLTISAVDQTWPAMSGVITWDGAQEQRADLQFCRDNVSFAPDDDNTANSSVLTNSRTDTYICRDASADRYYKVPMGAYGGCNSSTETSNVQALPFEVEVGVDDCMVYSMDKSHTSSYGARWDAQRLLELTDADVIENNIWPDRERGTTAGFTGSAGVTVQSISGIGVLDDGYGEALGSSQTALSGVAILCTNMEAGSTCGIAPVAVPSGHYEFSVMLRAHNSAAANWQVTLIDQAGVALPDGQVAMYRLDGGATRTAFTASTQHPLNAFSDWVMVQGWAQITDETGLGLQITSNTNDADANQPAIFLDEWGLEPSKTASLVLADHYVFQDFAGTHIMQVVGDSNLADNHSDQYRVVLPDAVRYMQAMPTQVVISTDGADRYSIGSRAKPLRPGLNLTIDSTFSEGGAALYDKVGTERSGATCIPHTDSTIDDALAAAATSTVFHFGQNDAIGGVINAAVDPADPQYDCTDWRAQLEDLAAVARAADRKVVVMSQSAITRSTGPGANHVCESGAGLTPTSCREVFDTMRTEGLIEGEKTLDVAGGGGPGSTDDRATLYAECGVSRDCFWYDDDAVSTGTGTEGSPYNASQRTTFLTAANGGGDVLWVVDGGSVVVGDDGFAVRDAGTLGSYTVMAAWPIVTPAYGDGTYAGGTGTMIEAPSYPDDLGAGGDCAMGSFITNPEPYRRYVGFRVRGTICHYDRDGLEVDNNVIWQGSWRQDNSNITGVFVQNATGVSIHDNVIRDMVSTLTAGSQAQGVLQFITTNVTIEHNEFVNAADGSSIGAVMLKEECDNCVIRRNLFNGVDTGLYASNNLTASNSVDFYENIVECTGNGRGVSIVKYGDDFDIYSNTFYNCGDSGSGGGGSESGAIETGRHDSFANSVTDVRVWANIVAGDGLSARKLYVNHCDDDRPLPETLDQNLYWNGAGATIWDPSFYASGCAGANNGLAPDTAQTTIAGWRTESGFDGDSVVGDPAFTNVGADDYSIGSGSAARGIACADPTQDPGASCGGAGTIDAGALQFGDTTTVIGVR